MLKAGKKYGVVQRKWKKQYESLSLEKFRRRKEGISKCKSKDKWWKL